MTNMKGCFPISNFHHGFEGILVSLIWGGSMLNNFAPLYVKPIHFNLGFSGTLRFLFVILLRAYFFSIIVHFILICSEDQYLVNLTPPNLRSIVAKHRTSQPQHNA